MNCASVEYQICDRLIRYLRNAPGTEGYVVGISGGIDSAVVSTLCAKSGLMTACLSMPIHQTTDQLQRANDHIYWLCNRNRKVVREDFDLTELFETAKKTYKNDNELALANTRSRLRMVTLYHYAQCNHLLVAGTGNRVEDYGVGFFTKYGDGGIDVSPIGDLMKTEVYELARYMGILDNIIQAAPTDGLWADNRTDESQLGATYAQLEWAMEWCDSMKIESMDDFERMSGLVAGDILTDKDAKIVQIYLKRHVMGAHKMRIPPIFKVEK